jgi:DNA-directed RNA polymerase subunit K/omega
MSISRPRGIGAFEFVVTAALRAAQLQRGCLPKIEGDHTTAVLAQREVAEGKVIAAARPLSQPATDALDS